MVEGTVERVELFEDRVTVTRCVVVDEQGSLHVGPLSPLVRETALSLHFDDPAGFAQQVAVQRKTVAPPEVGESLADERAAQIARVASLQSAHALAAHRVEQARLRAALARQSIGRAYRAPGEAKGLLAAARAQHEQVVQAIAQQSEAEQALARAREELEALELRQRSAHDDEPVVQAEIVGRVSAKPGTVVRLRYTLPCALWRPMHRATRQAEQVEWEVGAMVWNHTGEDWKQVELVCSTARPGAPSELPRLVDDRITAVKRSETVVVEARDEAVHVARQGEARAVDALPGVDDGGRVRAFTAHHRVDLPSDGRPVPVVLDRWSSTAQTRWVAAAERATQLVRLSRQVNAGPRPLLAGPVDLFGPNGALGRTEVGLVPPGEPFELPWQVSDEVVLHRDEKVEEQRSRGRTVREVRVTLRVSHLGDEPLQVELRERVPVSELASVRVSEATAEPPLSQDVDSDGLCAWSLRLEGGQTRELRLSYSVQLGAGVV